MHLLLLLTSLLIAPTLSHPTIVPRDANIAGASTGLSIKLYPSPNCHSTPSLSTNLLYDTQYARQFKSYSLSNDLDDQTITLYAEADWKATSPAGHGQHAGDDGNAATSCVQRVYALEADKTKKGCHTLDTWVGCLVVSVDS
ncbi:hypothetical protein N7G274_000700 [Stereocaulon virgatum]|uniref:Uncharacterized protein n=1 Tax=Stereocaulon virgatum TaxID=373712 RepID=A0ABR4AR83_9LECA